MHGMPYLGAWEPAAGRPFAWPTGKGPRVFLYTHNFAARDWLLGELACRGLPTVVYTRDLSRDVTEKLNGSSLLLAREPLDIHQAATECDFAILNAGHNSAAQFLLAGKPLLLVPVALEQGLLMRRLVEQGLAVAAPPDRPQAIAAALQAILTQARFRDAAREFAAKHRDYAPLLTQDEIVRRIELIAR